MTPRLDRRDLALGHIGGCTYSFTHVGPHARHSDEQNPKIYDRGRSLGEAVVVDFQTAVEIAPFGFFEETARAVVETLLGDGAGVCEEQRFLVVGREARGGAVSDQ